MPSHKQPGSEQIEIVSPSGEVHFFAVDPAVGIANIGQHPDNDIVLDGKGVRPFHGLIDFRQHPYQYASLTEDGGFGKEQPLTEWERLHIGGYDLGLVNANRSEQYLAHPSSPPTDDYTQTPSFPLLPDAGGDVRWRAQPGQTVRHNLTIQNSGDTPATFVIRADGLPEDWLWFSQQVIPLPAGGQAAVQLTVTPDPGPDTRPGIYPLVWHLESPDYPGWAQSEALYLEIKAMPLVQISKPEPLNVVSRPFRRAGITHITVANWGNTPANIYLNGQERRSDCIVHLEPVLNRPAPDTEVGWERPVFNGVAYPDDLHLVIPPGALTHIRAALIPRTGRRFGIGSIHYRFTLKAESLDGNFAPQISSGTFESRPAIRMGFLLLLAFVLALTGIYFFRGNLSAVGRARIDPTVSQEQTIVPSLTWMAPTADSVPRPLLSTGGPNRGQTGNMTYTEIFQEVATLYAMDWRQLVSQAYRESRLNPKAQGGSGEYGLMQILPATWDEWAPLVQVDDPWDPYSNVLVGAAYYSYIHSYFNDLGYPDPQWSLAAYNWGPERTLGLLDSGGDWFAVPLTQRMYVADILIGVENAPGLVDEAEIRYPQ